MNNNLIKTLTSGLMHGIKVVHAIDGGKPIEVKLSDFVTISYVQSGMYKMCLRPIDQLTEQELRNEGFWHHVDYTSNERDTLINRDGYDEWLNDIPFGIIQYLISKHFNIYNLSPDEFIEVTETNNPYR